MTGALPVIPCFALLAVAAHRAGRRVARWRVLCAAGGLTVCAVALGPLDPAADRGLTLHMAQHLMLGVVAPALVALGTPVRLAFAALDRPGRRRLAALLHRWPLRRLLHPAVAVSLAAAAMVLAHLPAVLGAVDRSALLHAGEHATIFWTAVGAWAALLGADPVPAAPGAIGILAAVTAWSLPMAAVGAFYASAGHVPSGISAVVGPDGLADVHAGGTLMLLAGPALMAPVGLLAGARALWRQEQRQRLRERLEVSW